MFGLSPVFSFSVKVPLSLSEYSHVIFLGVIIGVVGVSFNKTLLFIQSLYKKLPIKNEFKPIIAFMFALVFGFSFPYVLGGGHPVIEDVVEHRASTVLLIAILLLNLIFTAISYGSTAQGGIFLPVLVIGGIGGAIYYNIVKDFALIDVSHDYFVNFIVLAMAGMLSAVVRSPIISIMLVTEMTGSFEHILTLCMISIVSYLVAEMLKCKPIYESLLERMLGTSLQEDKDSFLSEKVLRQFVLSYDSKIINKKLKQVYLPLKSLIVSVERLGEEIIPKGDTVLKAGDRITVITDNKNLKYVTEYFENN
jgi:CPA2 family monovalent cation:proton (H+) antiporter-2